VKKPGLWYISVEGRSAMNENPPAELQRQLMEYTDYLDQTDTQRPLEQESVPDDISLRLRRLLTLLNS
jgi:hypothetical protein